MQGRCANRCAITAPRVTRTGTYGTGRAPQRGCIGLHLILYSIHNTATERRCERSHSNTPPVKKLAPLTTRSSNLRCVSAAEHQTAEQYSKTDKTNHLKHLPRSDLSWNTCQDFLKIPSRWEAALETERRCFSKVILESNVTPNITRSSDSFSTVPSIVTAGDWGRIVLDMETIIVLVLLAFNFIPQRSHHSFIFTRSRFKGLGMAQQLSKWSHRHNRSACSPKWNKAPRRTGGTIIGPKHSPAALLTRR